MEESISIREAVDDTLRRRGLLHIIVVLALIDALALLGQGTSIELIVALLSFFALGYSISYAREVAVDRSGLFPPLAALRVHARRALSTFVLVLPLGLVALVPYVAVLAAFRHISPTLGQVVLFVLVLLPLYVTGTPSVATFVVDDRVEFHLVRNTRDGWRNRRLLYPLLALLAGMMLVNMGMRAALGAVLNPPILHLPTSGAIPSVASRLAERPAVSLVAVVSLGLISAVLSLISSHALGQYSHALSRIRLGLTSTST